MGERRVYVRILGKVRGPFNLTQLKALRDRGQFRRFHEVSADRQTWVAASTITEVFPDSPARVSRAEGQDEQDTFAVKEDDGPTTPAAASPRGRQWYYTTADGEQHGPVSRDALHELRAEGTIEAATLVWSEGMPEWVRFSSLDRPARVREGQDEQDLLPWQRVRTGLTLTLVAAFILLGNGVFTSCGIFLSLLSGDKSGAAAIGFVVFLAVVVGFATQIVGSFGYGFCVAVPLQSGARGLSIAVLVLGILCSVGLPVLLVLTLAVGGMAPDRERFFPLAAASASAFLILYGLYLLLLLAKPLLFTLFLRSVAHALPAKALAQSAHYLSILYAVFLVLTLFSMIVALLYPEFVRSQNVQPAAAGALVLPALGIFVCALGLAWFVWYLLVLLQARRAVADYVEETQTETR